MKLREECPGGRNDMVKGQKQTSGVVCMFHRQLGAKDERGFKEGR